MPATAEYGPAGYPPRKGIDGEHERVSALVVSPLADDYSSLRAIFEQTRWTLHAAATCRDALGAASRLGVAAIISETDLPDGDWRHILGRLQAMRLPPRLIVTSRLADEQLWVEVLNLGGYDVLAQPFDSREVIRVLGLARRSWQDAGGHAPRYLAAG